MTLELLDPKQAGHIRHFDNLSRQAPNDWSFMGGKGVGQDDFGGYRFQLSYMVYALALTHRHRLPAAPGLFQPMMQRLIEKLLEPEVWLYWKDVSRGGSVYNAHLAGQLGEEWDPVVRDNIMYSAYVQSTALLHDYLFASDRYAQPGSLTFRHWSFFWGGDERKFEYDRESLNEHLYWLMVRNGYIGVACEPNCVFQICNQPAILGFRLHDLITGGNRAEEVVAGYERAWSDFGRLDDSGHYNMLVTEDKKTLFGNSARLPWIDAWCGSLMNMWNREFVHTHYPQQVKDFLTVGSQGTLFVPSNPRREVMGHAVVSDTCDFGWMAAWTSEMGDSETLSGLLRHADTFMDPTYLRGGLYYPRNDTQRDGDGNRTEIEPMSGNVLLGYARLNVPDGLWKLYNHPWDPSHFEEPALTAVGRDVEVSQAEVVDGALITRLRNTGYGPENTVTFGRIMGRGRWKLTCRGEEVARVDGTSLASTTEGLHAQGTDLVMEIVGEEAETLVWEPQS